MDSKLILSKVDHTLLSQTATIEEIQFLIDEAIRYQTASVCIPPCYVKEGATYAEGRIPICTVIGFPNGYQTGTVKVYEAKEAIEHGADEIDMVINLSYVKDKRYYEIQKEIEEIRHVCEKKILKVIIETCLLSDEEKIKMCKIVTEAGADYIKTSTGFSKAGANIEDILLFKEHIGENVKMKAAGGITSVQDAIRFIDAGADRLGTSRMIKILKKEEAEGY